MPDCYLTVNKQLENEGVVLMEKNGSRQGIIIPLSNRKNTVAEK